MTLLLRGGALVDGTGSDPIARSTVVVEDGRITSVSHTVVEPPAGADVLDLDGCTVLPGLIDAHTHLGIAFDMHHFANVGHIPNAEIAARVFAVCEATLQAGFTTCRDVGGLDGGVVRAIELGLVSGPRILPSGPAIAQDGGHATFMAPWSDCWCPTALPGLVDAVTVVNGPEEARHAARVAFRRGATQLKVMVSGGVISLTDELEHTQLTVAELGAAVEEADARGTYVTAHAHNSRGIRNGLAAGVACFEHGSFLDEETAVAMAKAGAAMVPTLAVANLLATEWREWGVPEAVVPRMRQVEGQMERSIGLARAAGVTIGSGSDLLGPRQNRKGLELVLRAELEDPMTAIVTATATNARILRIDDRVGTVEAGKIADLIAVRGDPLAEPRLFDDPDRVVVVVKDGVVVKQALGVSS